MKKVKLILAQIILLSLCILAASFAACAKSEFFTVTYKSEEGGFIVGNTVQTVEGGSDCIEVFAVAQTGYAFIGWDDGVSEAKRTDEAISENKEYTAKFSKIILTVIYEDAEGGVIEGETFQEVNYGCETTAVKAIPNEDYIFIGWSDGVPTTERTDKNIIFDFTVKPVFLPKEWKATYINADKLQTISTVVGIFDGAKVTATPTLGYKFAGWSDGITTATRIDYYNGSDLVVEAIFEIEFHNLPVVNITTEGLVMPSCEYVSAPEGCVGQGITNNDYVNCSLDLYDKNSNLIYETSLSGAKMKIRGNSSAYSEKKPYKIKLSKKTDLLAELVANRDNGVNYENKNWLLLATGQNLNQVIGWTVSETIDMSWTPAYSYVALYVNGDYKGLYILCESVEQGNGEGDKQSRCAVDDDGFIIEYDAYWWNEDLYFQSQIHSSMQYTFKYPDSDDITIDSDEYLYIENFIAELENALLNGDESYLNYIDEKSFAKWLLAQDLFANTDPAGSNIFLTKKDGTDKTKLTMGPIWDFDGINIYGSEKSFSLIRDWAIFYFRYLTGKESFVNIYNELFLEVKDSVVSAIEEKVSLFDAKGYNELISMEKERWGSEVSDLQSQLDKAVSWFNEHIQWMEKQLQLNA